MVFFWDRTNLNLGHPFVFCFSTAMVFPQPPHWELLFIFGSWLRQNRPKANGETLQSIHYNQRPKYFEFILEHRLRSTAYYDRYTIQIKKCNGQRADGYLLLTVAKDSTQKPLDYGQARKLSGKINLIAPPLNPGQFDYKSYLNSLGIYHQLKSTTLPTPLVNQSTSFFLQSKTRGIAALKRSNLNPPTKQLLHALIG